MGIKLRMYVIDKGDFEKFIQKTVKEALEFYAANCTNGVDKKLKFEDWPKAIYTVESEKVITMSVQKDNGWKIDDLNLPEYKQFLTKTVDKYIQTNNSFKLDFLLNSLADCNKVKFVKKIIEPNRYLWILSFTEYLKILPNIPSTELNKLIKLFNKIRRINPQPSEFKSFDFPVLPEEDSDLWMSVLNAEEVNFLLTFIKTKIDFEKAYFKTPAERTKFNDENDDESWDKLVKKMLNNILEIEKLNYKECNIITFIG